MQRAGLLEVAGGEGASERVAVQLHPVEHRAGGPARSDEVVARLLHRRQVGGEVAEHHPHRRGLHGVLVVARACGDVAELVGTGELRGGGRRAREDHQHRLERVRQGGEVADLPGLLHAPVPQLEGLAHPSPPEDPGARETGPRPHGQRGAQVGGALPQRPGQQVDGRRGVASDPPGRALEGDRGAHPVGVAALHRHLPGQLVGAGEVPTVPVAVRRPQQQAVAALGLGREPCGSFEQPGRLVVGQAGPGVLPRPLQVVDGLLGVAEHVRLGVVVRQPLDPAGSGRKVEVEPGGDVGVPARSCCRGHRLEHRGPGQRVHEGVALGLHPVRLDEALLGRTRAPARGPRPWRRRPLPRRGAGRRSPPRPPPPRPVGAQRGRAGPGAAGRCRAPTRAPAPGRCRPRRGRRRARGPRPPRAGRRRCRPCGRAVAWPAAARWSGWSRSRARRTPRCPRRRAR